MCYQMIYVVPTTQYIPHICIYTYCTSHNKSYYKDAHTQTDTQMHTRRSRHIQIDKQHMATHAHIHVHIVKALHYTCHRNNLYWLLVKAPTTLIQQPQVWQSSHCTLIRIIYLADGNLYVYIHYKIQIAQKWIDFFKM